MAGGRGGPRRNKTQQKQWLTDKREARPAAETSIEAEGSKPSQTGDDANVDREDWYCEKCVDTAGNKFVNFGSKRACFKCHVEKGMCFHSIVEHPRMDVLCADAQAAQPPRAGGCTADFKAYYEAQQLFPASSDPGNEYETLWTTLRSPLPTTIVVETSLPSAMLIEARLISDGWCRRQEFDRSGMSVWEMPGRQYSSTKSIKSWAERENRRGSLVFQELVSLVPALLLDPSPDHLCLDLCAAPGNKSVQLIKAIEKGGTAATGAVVSGELDAHRCCIVLQRVLAKARSTASAGVFANAQHFPALYNESIGEKLPFSRILVDVPCSGDGTARKNMQVWHAWRRRESLELFSKQRNILLRALYLLPPGGRCVYSTCSMNPLENEAVVISALRRWNRDEKHDAHVELVDASVACAAVCDLKCDRGLSTWKVPSPERFGPIFSSWADVPEELRLVIGKAARSKTGPPACKYPLRQEMFPEGEEADAGSVSPELMQNCARFVPQRGDTGGFFVAVFEKSTTMNVEKEKTPFPATVGKKGQLAMHGRAHPLLAASWKRVARDDQAWLDLVEFYGIDAAWAEDHLNRGLLFWQILSGQISRLSVVSPGVARIFDATPGDRKELPWVRLGTFMFEQLPRGFLIGVMKNRWQVDLESANTAATIVSRRVIKLPAKDILALLRAENRQLKVTENRFVESRALQAAIDEGGLAHLVNGERQHVCGGVLVGLQSKQSEQSDNTAINEVWLPAVLAPMTFRLLVCSVETAALVELLQESDASGRSVQCASCWIGVQRLLGVSPA